MKTKRHPHIAYVAAVVFSIALSAAACASDAPTPSPSPSPEATGSLLTVETRGGLCANGPCGTTIIIERNGDVHLAAKPPNELGQVPADIMAELDLAIQATDFAELASHRFSGTCPTAYDGQELVFEFATPTGLQRIATCEVDVDFNSPLFVAVRAAVGEFLALPEP